MRKCNVFLAGSVFLSALLILPTLSVAQTNVVGPTGTYTPYSGNQPPVPVVVSPPSQPSDLDSTGGKTYGDTNYRVDGAGRISGPTGSGTLNRSTSGSATQGTGGSPTPQPDMQ